MSDNEPNRKKRQSSKKSVRQTKATLDNASQDTTESIANTAPGTLFKQAREQQGKTIDDVAAYFKLNTYIIDNMEKNHYEDQKLTVYTRGYLRHYTNYLGLNYDDIITALANLNINVNYDALPCANTLHENTSHTPKLTFNQQDVRRLIKWLVMITTCILMGSFILRNIDPNTPTAQKFAQAPELSKITQLISLKKSQQKHMLMHTTTKVKHMPEHRLIQDAESTPNLETIEHINEQNITQ